MGVFGQLSASVVEIQLLGSKDIQLGSIAISLYTVLGYKWSLL
jgi:hypothetical protein